MLEQQIYSIKLDKGLNFLTNISGAISFADMVRLIVNLRRDANYIEKQLEGLPGVKKEELKKLITEIDEIYESTGTYQKEFFGYIGRGGEE